MKCYGPEGQKHQTWRMSFKRRPTLIIKICILIKRPINQGSALED